MMHLFAHFSKRDLVRNLYVRLFELYDDPLLGRNEVKNGKFASDRILYVVGIE